jgi:uncharacterized protein YceK
MRKIAIAALLLSVSFIAGGCGTSQSASIWDFSPYAGTKLDTWIAENYPSDRVLAALDWPLSFVADTALLPVSALLYPHLVLGRDEEQWAY